MFDFYRSELELSFGSLRATLVLTSVSIGILALAGIAFEVHFNLLDWSIFNVITNLEIGFGRLMMSGIEEVLELSGLHLDELQHQLGTQICTAYCLVGVSWAGVLIPSMSDYAATYGHQSDEEMTRVGYILSWIVRLLGPFLWPLFLFSARERRRATATDIANKTWPELSGEIYRPKQVVLLNVIGSIIIASIAALVDLFMF